MLLFRDSDHVAKVMRNCMIETGALWTDTRQKVDMPFFRYLLQRGPDVPVEIAGKLKKLINFKTAFPASYEKLRMEPVKRLCDATVVNFLSAIDSKLAIAPQCQSLARFLTCINDVLYLWDPPIRAAAHEEQAKEEGEED